MKRFKKMKKIKMKMIKSKKIDPILGDVKMTFIIPIDDSPEASEKAKKSLSDMIAMYKEDVEIVETAGTISIKQKQTSPVSIGARLNYHLYE